MNFSIDSQYNLHFWRIYKKDPTRLKITVSDNSMNTIASGNVPTEPLFLIHNLYLIPSLTLSTMMEFMLLFSTLKRLMNKLHLNNVSSSVNTNGSSSMLLLVS